MTTPRAGSDRYFDPHIETMPRDQLERLQEVRILQLVPYVYQRSALIREAWDEAGVKPSDIRSLADFKAKVPFIDKDRIRRFRDTHSDPFGGLRCADAPHLRGVGFTSGTAGDPTPLPRSEHHIPLDGMQREMWHIGARPHDYMTYSLFTFREGLNFDKFTGSGTRPVCVPHLPFEMANLVAVTRQFRPATLFMLSTPLIMGLQQYQQKTGDDLHEALLVLSRRGLRWASPSVRACANWWKAEASRFSSSRRWVTSRPAWNAMPATGCIPGGLGGPRALGASGPFGK